MEPKKRQILRWGFQFSCSEVRSSWYNGSMKSEQITASAIRVRILPATNNKGRRVSVSSPLGRKVYAWEYSFNTEQMVEYAAKEYLSEKIDGASVKLPGLAWGSDTFFSWDNR